MQDTSEDSVESTSESRRALLKAIAASGAIGAGTLASSGSAAAEYSTEGIFDQFEIRLEGPNIRDSDVSIFLTEFDATGGDVQVGGLLRGHYTTTDGSTEDVDEHFSGFDLGTTDEIFGVVEPESHRCPILTLDLGPLFLDLLGLEIDLSRIELDITAVAGPNNLLGNLLCAIVGLLDP